MKIGFPDRFDATSRVFELVRGAGKARWLCEKIDKGEI